MKFAALLPLLCTTVHVAKKERRFLDRDNDDGDSGPLIPVVEAEAQIAEQAKTAALAKSHETEANVKLKEIYKQLWEAEDAAAAAEKALANALKNKPKPPPPPPPTEEPVEINVKAIAKKAAANAVEKAMDQIKEEAKIATEKAKRETTTLQALTNNQVADAVGAAMQPYHLAMLRAQKAVAVTHRKAVLCIEAAQRLVSEAHALVVQGQVKQMGGDWLEAARRMMRAHYAMNGAVTLKKQGENLQGLAMKINGSISEYATYMNAAAVHAETLASAQAAAIAPSIIPAIDEFVNRLKLKTEEEAATEAE